jgi:hypothetical protein
MVRLSFALLLAGRLPADDQDRAPKTSGECIESNPEGGLGRPKDGPEKCDKLELAAAENERQSLGGSLLPAAVCPLFSHNRVQIDTPEIVTRLIPFQHLLSC